jgi:hypothetical protein
MEFVFRTFLYPVYKFRINKQIVIFKIKYKM